MTELDIEVDVPEVHTEDEWTNGLLYPKIGHPVENIHYLSDCCGSEVVHGIAGVTCTECCNKCEEVEDGEN